MNPPAARPRAKPQEAVAQASVASAAAASVDIVDAFSAMIPVDPFMRGVEGFPQGVRGHLSERQQPAHENGEVGRAKGASAHSAGACSGSTPVTSR